MSSYGRNFDFRRPPQWNERGGRYFVAAGGTTFPIGSPVAAAAAQTPDANRTGALEIALKTGATAPLKGLHGIAVYEWLDLHQLDPQYFTASDRDMVPVGQMCQLVSGPGIKVVFRNTDDRSFFGQRDYAGRIMVAGFGATPTVAVGDMLTPGTGNDDAGYWAETGSATNAWLRVTGLNHDRGEIEAEMLF